MELKIYTQSGILRAIVCPDDNSTQQKTVMGENVVNVAFTVSRPVDFDVNDYIDFCGERYTLLSRPHPEQESTIEYKYTLNFYGIENELSKAICFLQDGESLDSDFSLTDSPAAHLQLVVNNINRIKGTGNWKVGSVIDSDYKAVTYDGIDCLTALNRIAETFETEWWIVGTTIYLSKCEHGELLELGYAPIHAEAGGLLSFSKREEENRNFFTRLYAKGSTRNIDRSKYGSDNLRLPEPLKYLENNTQYGIVEREVIFDDIYPQRIGTVSGVRSVERETEDGKITVYYIKDSGLDFNPNDYEIAGLVKHIHFETGELSGFDFEANYDTSTEEFELINQYSDDGTQIPGGVLVPGNGDKYILYNIRMPDEYYPLAEQELLEKATEYLGKYSVDNAVYSGESDPILFKKRNLLPDIGQRVRLYNSVFFPEGYRDSRIIAFSRSLNNPYEVKIDVGEYVSIGRFESLERQVASILPKVSGGDSDMNIIKAGDKETVPTDYNVFSALASISRFLRKDGPDSTRYLLSLLGGAICDNLESQDFAAGPFGTGYVLKRNPKTGRSYLELDEIYVRLKAYFETLEIKHLSHVGGRIVLSPAGMECIRVEEVSAEHEELYDSAGNPLVDSLNDPLFASKEGGEKAYRCYFKQEEDGKEIVNEFAVDDLAQCREFNVKENVSQQVSNQYYWRRVIYVGEDYIDLSIDDCDPISMVPKAGDTIVTIGNKTDVNRQHVVFLSSYDEDAPCIKLYSGINSYSMLNKEVTVISPNVDKNMFTGQVVIKPGSTGFENLDDAPDMGLIEQEIQEAKDAAEAAKGEIRDVQESVGDLKGYVDGAFSDGIISESEAASIEKYINIVNNEKQQALATYNGLYNNPYLEGSAKTSLSNAKVSLFSSIDALINAINTAIADGKATSGEKSDVDTKYATFTTDYNKFYAAVESANKSIQDKLKGYSDNAQMAADKANNNASQAMEDANEAKEAVTNLNDYVDGAFADGIISEAEAKAIEKYINIVNQTKKDVDSTYSVLYNNPFLTGTAKQNLYSAKSLFNTATSNLISSINSAIADGKTTTTEKNNVDSKYSSFNSAYSSLATAIENANKAIQEKIKEEAITEAKKDLDAQIGEVSLADKDEIAKNMGYSNYEEMVYYAERSQTIIKGGHINLELLEASLIVTSQLIANAIKANTLNINNNFIVKTDGSVDMNGILHSLGRNTELVISDGYVRIMYKGSDVAKLSVNENTGMPELSMYKGNRSVLVTAEKIMLATGSGSTSFLTLDASEIGYGTIKKKTDGTLYVANNEYTMITVGISVSPSYGGTTIPSPSPLHMVMQGESETVEAIPADGYEFDRWSDGGSQKHTVTWSTSGQSLVAYFTKIQVTKYTLALSASPSYAGTTSGAGTYETGTRVTVNATPNSGYRFVRWSDGGAQSHYVTMDANKSLTAYFEAYSITGDEIFTGTALTSSTYWKAFGQSSIVSVTGGVATIKFSASDTSGSTYVMFNKGYLGSKIEQGHKYRLTFQIKASISSAQIIALIGSSFTDSVSTDGIIYGDYNGGNISSSYKTISLTLTADNRDSNTSDGFCIVAFPACTIYIKSISLKEV